MIILQTPLRVSLFGGGTDFPEYFQENGGCVLTSAIDKHIFVIIRRRFDKKLRIGYTRTELVDHIDEIQHELIREAFRVTGLDSGIEITTMGDIPSEGSGLGSSSTVTVGALHAMYAYKREMIGAERLAREASYIERDVLKKPIGIQDQYIAALGGFRLIEFSYNGEVASHPVVMPPDTLRRLNQNLLLFYTGVTRKAESILAEQKQSIGKTTGTLDEMKRLTYYATEELGKGNIDMIGEILHESWQLKKQLASQISSNYLDDMYTVARQSGAIGGKIAGAGGGGFLLLYCPLHRQEQMRSALSTLQELPFNLDQDGSKVIFDYKG